MKGIAEGLSIIGNIADDLITTKEEKAKAELEFRKLEAKLAVGQLEVNKMEAQHKSLFVSGWRPFIGWVCGVAFAYNFVGYPILQYFSVIFDWAEVKDLPHLDISDMMPVLLGMLGLGGLRTYEKQKGVASEALQPKKEKRGLFGFLKKKK